MLAPLFGFANNCLLAVTPLLAQAEEEAERPYNIEVALIMLCVGLGVWLSVRPSKREVDFRKPNVD